MARLDYPTFRLLESCADQGGYLVQRKEDGSLVATIVKHPDDPAHSRWEVRPYDSRDTKGGRHRLLKEAAEAGYDEWSGDVPLRTRILLVRGGQHWQLQTGFRYPSGNGGVVHNLGKVRELGMNPPYELADRTVKAEHGVQVTNWVRHAPELGDYPVWRAVY